MTELSATLNLIGLIWDIFGVGMVFKYGLPENISRGGKTYLATRQVDETEAALARQYDFWSRFGLAFLLAGFVMQAVANSVLLG